MMHHSRITFLPMAYDRVSVILKETAARHEITINDLRGKSRKHYISHPRQEAMTRLYDETAMSYPAIARIFDCDHTTVLYGVRAHRQRLKSAQE